MLNTAFKGEQIAHRVSLQHLHSHKSFEETYANKGSGEGGRPNEE